MRRRHDEEPDIATELIVTIIIFVGLAALVAMVPITLFIAVPTGLLWIAYKVGMAFANSASARERRAKQTAHERYNAVLRSRPKFPTATEFVSRFRKRMPGGIPQSVADAYLELVHDLYEAEGFGFTIQPPPPVCDSLEGWRYLDYLAAEGAKSHHLSIIEPFSETLWAALDTLTAYLPDTCDGEDTGLSTRLCDSENCGTLVQDLIADFYAEENAKRSLYADMRATLTRNFYEASGLPPDSDQNHKLVLPTSYKGENVVFAYLKDTPLLVLLNARMPFSIPERTRFEHHHIVAGTGHGKSQTLQHFIANDLQKVAAGKASVVVLDSQGELIRKISRLKLFAPGEPLADRLVLIDPTDISHPVTLGLFSVGKERMQTYAELDRERLQNSLVELLSFTLGSLMGAEMTAKQATLFAFLIRAMLVIPGATIHTFRELLEVGGETKFKPHLDTLSGAAKLFFETEYSDPKQYGETRKQVLRRLWGILENNAFERMMSSADSKLDLFTEMQAGKVILINADKSLLQTHGTEIFGRFFIAMIAQAAQERKANSLPCFVYIDEFGDYAANADSFITNIFQQARKRNIGMVVAHQTLSDLSAKTGDSLAANTSIKFVGGASHADATKLARDMRTTPDFVHARRKGTFAAFVRNQTPSAVSLEAPFGRLEGMEQMMGSDWKDVQKAVRQRYAQPRTSVGVTVVQHKLDVGDVDPS